MTPFNSHLSSPLNPPWPWNCYNFITITRKKHRRRRKIKFEGQSGYARGHGSLALFLFLFYFKRKSCDAHVTQMHKTWVMMGAEVIIDSKRSLGQWKKSAFVLLPSYFQATSYLLFLIFSHPFFRGWRCKWHCNNSQRQLYPWTSDGYLFHHDLEVDMERDKLRRWHDIQPAYKPV